MNARTPQGKLVHAFMEREHESMMWPSHTFTLLEALCGSYSASPSRPEQLRGTTEDVDCRGCNRRIEAWAKSVRRSVGAA